MTETLAPDLDTPQAPSRRALLGAAAWAVPAVAVAASTPAFATSGSTVNLTIPAGSDGTVPPGLAARGKTPVRATTLDGNQHPINGTFVNMSVNPSGSLVDANGAPASSGVSDGSGIYTTNYSLEQQWAKAGTMITVTATAAGVTTSRAFPLCNANGMGFGQVQAVELGDGGPSGPGTGTGLARSTPSQFLPAFPSPISQIVSCGAVGNGPNHTTAVLLEDGTVWTVGGNDYAQLGWGFYGGTYASWRQVTRITGITQIASNNEGFFALASDGVVHGWGTNYGMVLRSGAGVKDDTAWVANPTPLSVLPTITQIAGGTQQAYFLDVDGKVWAAGRNTFGAALGDPDYTASDSGSAGPRRVVDIPAIKKVASGHQGGYALSKTGEVWSWGSNYAGALGQGTNPCPPAWYPGAPTYAQASADKVVGLPGSIIDIAGNFAGGLALAADGTVWAWGDNATGFVGGSDSVYSVPQKIALTDVAQISASGSSGYALKNDGSVWAWGQNTYGQLGDGTTTNRSTPVQVTGLTGLTVASLMRNSGSTQRMYVVIAT